ncbi:MAG: hypothetical protein ACR2NG_03585, partial [Acidimicrobiia bacterium]
MSDLRSQLRTYVESTIERADVDDVIASVSTGHLSGSEQSRRFRPVWAATAAAALVLLLVGVPLLVWGTGENETVGHDSSSTVPDTSTAPSTTQPMSTTTLTPTTTIVVSPQTWNPILTTFEAKAAPPAAECQSGSNAEVPGPVDQPRPEPIWTGNLKGAFDQHAGRVVYVDVTGETWLLDVCTNTWHQASPDGTPVPPASLYDGAGQPSGMLGQLVYDTDSDLTVMLGYGRVSVYDADANHWTPRSIDPGPVRNGQGPYGAVYEPTSGLIITSFVDPEDQEVWNLWGYDVDTNKWMMLGPVTIDRDTPCCTQVDLLGYSDDLNRLILVTYVGRTRATFLVDPRTGDATVIPNVTVPIVDLGWPNHSYGQADGTVHVYDQTERHLCWFDADAGTWPCSSTGPSQVGSGYYAFGAIVDDPINDRILLIHGIHGGWWSDATDDVWAYDFASGQWTQIVAPSAE